ncbi:MAG: caspase family protein [Pseudomonadales bacterium]|nr:caspase family protein [Pseudomonadales bacterium]
MMFRLIIGSLLVMTSLLVSQTTLARQKALVVGIKDYNYWSRLQNSRNDAEDIAATLQNLGFETTLITRNDQGEVNNERFNQALQQFSQNLRPDDRVIFFYSGHGAAIPTDGGSTEGYLIASNTPAPSRGNKIAIQQNAIALKQIAETISNKIDPDVGSILFMIDACRNEVINRGADVVEESTPSQPLSKQIEVIYATSNGSTSLDKLPTDNQSRNGVFTRVAIEELNRHKNNQGYSSDAFFPAVKIKALQLAKAAGKTQVPAWMNDTGRESFVFVPCPTDQACNVVIDNSTTINHNSSADKQFWDEIKSSTDANDYRAYLKQFPNGSFVALAESRRDKYSQSTKQSSVLESLRLPDTKKAMSLEEMQKERENNPNGTSIYDSLQIKRNKSTTVLDSLRLPEKTAKDCQSVVFDLDTGTINGIKPTVSQDDVKAALPCFTGSTPDGDRLNGMLYNYGGGVFFNNHNFYFYTGSDFIEVRSDFTGTVSPSLLGVSKERLNGAYGRPTLTSNGSYFYMMSYGCLQFELRNNVVYEIRSYYQDCKAASEVR